jgi:predicted Zn-dependent protease
LKLDHPEQAAKAFQSAIVLDPSLTTPYSGLAQIYRAQNRYADALSMLNHAVARQPNSAILHYLRGQVLARLHRKPGAPSQSADAQTTEQAAEE